jgi:hypothetical protein
MKNDYGGYHAGLLYPDLGASVAKFRRIENPTREQRVAHADAIEKAIRAKQKQELQRELPSIRCRCASGTWHNGYIDANGRVVPSDKIGPAVREQQRNALLAYPDYVRRNRTSAEWERLYEAAMNCCLLP